MKYDLLDGRLRCRVASVSEAVWHDAYRAWPEKEATDGDSQVLSFGLGQVTQPGYTGSWRSRGRFISLRCFSNSFRRPFLTIDVSN